MKKTVITANKRRWMPDWTEILRFRQLLFSLAWRDIRVRYAQTYIGVLWAVINPLLNLLILSFVFGTIAQVKTPGVPHLLFTMAGLAGWTYFSTLLSESGSSIIGAQSMIKKIYFPRLIIPLSKALSGLLDFLVTLVLLLLLILYYGIPIGPQIVYLPLFLMMAILCGLAGGIFVSAVTTRFRDFRFVVPMIVRLGFYASPVAYSAASVPERWKSLYYINPMAGIIEGFRWSILGTGSFEPYMMYSLFAVVVLLVISLSYFTRVENTMADII